MLRLNRLSSARAINVRFTCPGHPFPLDRHLPVFVCPQFTLRVIPNTLLRDPVDFVPLNPLLATGLVRTPTRRAWWSNLGDVNDKATIERRLADAYTTALAKCGRHNISLLFRTSKKATSKSSVVRRRLRSKMTTAIDLVVARNADAVPAPGNSPSPPLNLVSLPIQENEPLVLKDWTYLAKPDLSIYKMPLPNLVQVVRKAFLTLHRQAKRVRSPRSKRTPPPPPLKMAVDDPESATLTQTRPLLRPASERADAPRESAKPKSVATRLYSVRPVILPPTKKAD